MKKKKKIEQDKPLPSHTTLDYHECYAKVVLEELFPDRYHDLLLADKPDLQGVDVGIEVTMENDPQRQEALSNWVHAGNCQDEKVRACCIDRMKQLNVEYTGGVQKWPIVIPTFDWTKQTVEKKIQKLQTGQYKVFQRYELFIFADTWYHEDIVKEAQRYLFNNSISNYYQTVYVLSKDRELHLFITETGEYKNIRISASEQINQSSRARRMVEEAEEQ